MLKREIEIPEGLEVGFEKGRLNVKGTKGEVSKTLRHPKIKLEISKDRITITSESERKKKRAKVGTGSPKLIKRFFNESMFSRI